MTAAAPSVPRRSWPRRLFAGLWWLLDGTRRVLLNLLLLVIVVALVWAWWSSRPQALADKTVLVMSLSGPIVEQRPGSAPGDLLRRAQGDDLDVVVLRDVIATLDAAASDPKIGSVLLELGGLQGGGLASLREVAAAIQRFKASGKLVVAYGLRYSQSQYFVAAHASEVYLHPGGSIAVSGYGRQRNYYADALDKLGVKANVIKAGQYKNFAEPFTANAPSAQTLEQESALFGALWQIYTRDVEAARKLPAGAIDRMVEALPGSLQAVGGDLGRLLVEARVVDALLTPDELRQKMLGHGVLSKKTKTFAQIDAPAYRARIEQAAATPTGGRVGVVVAEGSISEGRAPAGEIGGLSTAELIRKAREDDEVQAVVLRVNSPGGSALGSELIRRELEITRAAGKPVVVSMGDVAASGGYWISMAADEVLAEPSTITGSIGVVTLLPTAEALWGKLGVHTAGTRTTWLGGAYDPRTGISARYQALLQSLVDEMYRDFVGKAAAARKLDPAQLERHAQGRVWTGTQAVERGLLDRTGSFNDALKAARSRAQLPEGAALKWIEPDRGRVQQVLDAIGVSWAVPQVAALVQSMADAGGAGVASTWLAADALSAGSVGRDLHFWHEQMQRASRGEMTGSVHCLCTGWSAP